MTHGLPVITNSKTVFECPRYSIRHDELDLPNGTKDKCYVIDMTGAAGVIALSEGKVLMISQYRHPLAIVSYEFPMGGRHEGETPQDAALREFAEETGFAPINIKPLCVIDPLQGLSNLQVTVFVVLGVKSTLIKKDIEEFDIEKHWFTPEQIDEMIATDKINNAITISAWYKYKLTQK